MISAGPIRKGGIVAVGIFSKREDVVDVPVPDLDAIPLTDPKYIHQHLGEVGSLLEAMQYRQQDPKFQVTGERLAKRLMDGFPGEGFGPADVSSDAAATLRDMVEAGLAVSATNGFGLASLYGASTPTSKAMYETLVWAGYITLPEVMRPLAAAHVFACQAGHFIGHHGDAVTDSVVERMDWTDVWRGSKAVVVVADLHSKSWSALCGA